jgi:WhiB family transcriptional regulator, redox-sensing transcriptional regulator
MADWKREAACSGVSQRVFFQGPRSKYVEARRFCETCPVRFPCARYAIDNNIPDGFFGGLDPNDRDRIRLKRRRTNAARRVS